MPLRDRAREADRADLEARVLRGRRRLDRGRDGGSRRPRRARARRAGRMRVTVRLFARLRDIVGAAEMEREIAAGRDGRHGLARSWRRSFRALGALRAVDFGGGQRRLRAHGRRGRRRRRGRVPAARLRRIVAEAIGPPRCAAAMPARERAGAATASASGVGPHEKAVMFDKLPAVEQRYDELLQRLGTVEVQNDPAEYRKQAKALAEIEPLVEKFREYKAIAQRRRADRGAGRVGRHRHARARARRAEGARRAARRPARRAEDPARPEGSERREERRPRDPRRHGRRRGGAVRGRAVPDVSASTPSGRAGGSR